jgi:thiol:disulfide interchange protein DsbD
MATALGYALTAPAPAALAVFLALGTGFALPFSAVAFVPALAKMIPRPGPWMMGLREFLAFPLLGTAVWLSWVLNRQVGPTAMMLALFCLLGVVFAGWLWRQSRSWSRALAAILAAGAMIFAGLVFRGPAAGSAKEIHWAAWSPEAVQAAQRSGRPIFVDFSAAWCVTCLVNEHVALSDRAIVEGFARDRVVALKADWTNRDDAISAELRSHARDGVPLYLFYPGSEEAPPTVLPQILTPAAVLSALKLAEKPGASI